MPMPPNAGPNVVLLMQRLDLIEKKIDWIAGRVASLTYADGAPARGQGDQPTTEEGTLRVPASKAAEPIRVVDDHVAAPLPATGSPATETTPPESTPATGPGTETSEQVRDTPLAQAVDGETSRDEEAAVSVQAQGLDSPSGTVAVAPMVQHHEEPGRTTPEQSSWTSPGFTGRAPAPPNGARTRDPHQEKPTATGRMGTAEADELPGWARRAMREGNLGRYLLSGAAAVLVLSAGVSLLALVWDFIPDPVKILALALIAVTMTAAARSRRTMSM